MRKIIIAILLLTSLYSEAQIINASAPYRPTWAISCSYILDQYPNAAVAYSLRKLDCDYTGYAIRVRRSSDNSEQDIGFTSNGDLDTASLKTFVSTNSGYVVTWYDQSGNVANVAQSTSANQPLIVDNGVVIRQKGNPSIYFDGSNDYLTIASLTLNTYLSLYLVVKSPAHFLEQSNDAVWNNGFFFHGNSNSSWLFRRTSLHYDYGVTNWTGGNFVLADLQYNGSGSYYKNSVAQSNNTITGSALSNTSTTAVFNIMARPTQSLYFSGYVSELVIYDSDKSADASNIRNNINTYYSIY